jgi:hypothetical protein
MSSFPHLDAYVARLPNGFDSYPQAELKASVLHNFFGDDKKLLSHHASKLPAPVRALIEKLPAESAWVRECHATGLFMALIDAELHGEDAFIDFAYRKNKKLLDSIAYRILFRVLRPRTVVNGAVSRWDVFHRGGVTLELVDVADDAASIRLRYPAHLVPPVMARAYTTAFRAAIELAGAKGCSVDLVASDDASATFVARWR